jgi:8-oxo-dGTP pyrophosphatase MutT (NUDIX family)
MSVGFWFLSSFVFMHTIYFNTRPLFIISEVSKEVKLYLEDSNTVRTEEISEESIKTLVAKLVDGSAPQGVIITEDIKQAIEVVKNEFHLIQAAGGLVYTSDHQILLIFRRGKWDLPKGKLDEGEDLAQCAVREVEEETGLTGVRLEQPLCISYHTYQQDGKAILKESHWYMMQAQSAQVLTPQVEEDIEKCEWVAIDRLAPYMEDTHPSIVDVLKEGIKQLGEGKRV